MWQVWVCDNVFSAPTCSKVAVKAKDVEWIDNSRVSYMALEWGVYYTAFQSSWDGKDQAGPLDLFEIVKPPSGATGTPKKLNAGIADADGNSVTLDAVANFRQQSPFLFVTNAQTGADDKASVLWRILDASFRCITFVWQWLDVCSGPVCCTRRSCPVFPPTYRQNTHTCSD